MLTRGCATVLLAVVLLIAPAARGQVIEAVGSMPMVAYDSHYGLTGAVAPPLVGSAYPDFGAVGTTFGGVLSAPAGDPIARYLDAPGYVPPYSYYAAPDGFPPRIYAGLGSVDGFPFHGQPYGAPYDRWTWPYMSSYPASTLVRYYYPPVR